MKKLFTIIFSLLMIGANAQMELFFAHNGSSGSHWEHSKTITIDHTITGSDLTNFIFAIKDTLSYLKTVANGGNVRNSNGYDIAFYSDAGLTTRLKWEREKYVSTTGEICYWVRLPSISATSDLVIYLAYGDATITTDQSQRLNTWASTDYRAIYHFANGTSLNTMDATSNGYDLTNSATTATSGIVDGAASFDGSTSYLTMNGDYWPTGNAARTVSFWFNTSSVSSRQAIFYTGTSGAAGRFFIEIESSKLALNYTDAEAYGSTTLSDNTWYHLTVSYDGSTIRFYLNGVADGTATYALTTQPTADLFVGAFNSTPALVVHGTLDELQVSDVARSAAWISAEYKNQKLKYYTIT